MEKYEELIADLKNRPERVDQVRIPVGPSQVAVEQQEQFLRKLYSIDPRATSHSQKDLSPKRSGR